MTKKELMQQVAEAYPGSFPESRAQARRHEVGDTLADFIYLELDETLDNDEVDLETAEIEMLRALDDVDCVLRKIQDLNWRTKNGR